jgi:group I intron endonuclease
MGIIYKATNKINGKEYIGQSKVNDLRYRIKTHKWRSKEIINTHFYNSIKKHGWDNFEWEVIEKVSNEELSNKEKFYIDKFDTFNNGMNMTIGGKVNIITNEIRKKLTNAQINRFKNKEERKKISNLHSKWFIIENIKTKESFLVFGLHNFCKKYGLDYSCMKNISRGKMKIHKEEWSNVRRLL